MLRLSPSTLGNFFFLDCDRMLRYAATPKELQEEQGVPSAISSKSVVTEAIIERGRTWEERVVREKLKGDVLMGPEREEVRLCERILPQQKVLEAIHAASPEQYLYQAHLEPPETFYRRYGINPADIIFSPCRPDLIQLQKRSKELVQLHITDIKGSDKTKFSHCVQTVLYVLILRDILQAERISHCQVDLQSCAIWLLEKEQPEEFDMTRLLEPLEAFLRERLPSILLQPARAARWSLSTHCEWCDYLEYCRKEAEERQDVSLLPYFPKQAKYFLAGLDEPVTTLVQLDKFLAGANVDRICRTCGSLVGRKERLKAEVTAMLSRTQNDKGVWRGGEPVPYGTSSIALPKGQNVGIVLNLHQDPLTGNIFAAGLHIQGGKEIHHEETPWTMVADGPDSDSCAKVIAAFLEKLERVMRAIHDYNVLQTERTERKSLQCYVYDKEEKELLEQMLSDAVKNPELAERALSLFFYFQSERLVDTGGGATSEIPFPVIVVTDVLRELIALPVTVTYKLSSVSFALKPSQYASFYSSKGEFSFPFSNKLRTDPIFKAWSGGEKDQLEQTSADLRYEIEKRLKATFSVLAGLRERVGQALFTYPPKFFLPERTSFVHPLFAKLSFVTRYEEVLSYLEIHAGRTASRAERLEAGSALRIQLLQQIKPEYWEAVLAEESAHITPEASGYMEWLLAEDNEGGYREQMSFPDFWYKEQPWVPRKAKICFAGIDEIWPNDGQRRLRLEIKSGASSPDLKEEAFYLLHERYTDFTSRRILNELKKLDAEEDNRFLALVSDPHQALQKRTRPKGTKQKKSLENFLRPFGFTESQKTAFIRILDHSHQLVWGPPGTGKTHFLGLCVLALVALAQTEGNGIKVLVTAFTHTAIENCLKMIARLAREHSALVPALQISKLGGWRGKDAPEGIVSEGSWYPLESVPQVVGCTIFTIAKEMLIPPSQQFDLVIIDEASQLRVAEAAIPISRVASTGRLIIAGDDKQLGPIVKGNYPEPAADEMSLFGSIFECLRRPDQTSDTYTSELIECFRMNDTLCRFPAQTIYGTNFCPANDGVGQWRLNLARPQALPVATGSISDAAVLCDREATRVSKVRIVQSERPRKVRILDVPVAEPKAILAINDKGYVDWAVAPDYPLVLLILENVPALAENPVEAGVVADIAINLRQNLLQKGRTYQEDQAFWQKGLFIVSPHHVQIQSIHQELTQRKKWDYPPFVDTVNKMQGQESDCVIVSYGVADIDYALKEGEFIYSLNRLNVAITRAKAKAIVCLPAPLFTPPLSAFGRDELLEGLDFMLKLRRLVGEGGEKAEFLLPQAGTGARLIGLRTK